MASSVAKRARSVPPACAEPIIAMPMMLITFFTSAKSKLMIPGQVTTSEMPATALRNTSSAARKASFTVTSSPKADINLSFGITINESTWFFKRSKPSLATTKRLPSYSKGRVTTATVKIPISLAMSATTGAAPVPVPPPMPAVMNTILAPFKASAMASRSSKAAFLPTSGFAPAPKPRVKLVPSCMRLGAWFSCNDCASVLALMNSTPCTELLIILLMALHPPPPIPMTLITAGLAADSTTSYTNCILTPTL